MDLFISFVIRHWELWTLFAALLLALAGLEVRDRIRGIHALSPQQVTHLINREDAVILDVRDNNSYTQGHIIDAINIPLKELKDQLNKLEKYKARPIIITYGANQSVSAAATLLLELGFAQVNTLKGGMATWQSANLPLQKS